MSEPNWSIVEDGDVITIGCEVGDKSHSVKVHGSSMPVPEGKRYSEMSDEELVAAEKHSFAEFLAGAGQ